MNVAVVQARLGSERFPRKVLATIGDFYLLHLLLERLQHCTTLDEIAVTVPKEDTELATLVRLWGYPCFATGVDRNVLGEYVHAANELEADTVVRITGDCPLIDPETVDRVVRAFDEGVTLATNAYPRTYPRGFDTEVIAYSTLRALDSVPSLTQDCREHPTRYLYQHAIDFNVRNVWAPQALCRPDYRLCVDEPEDLEVVRKLVAELGYWATAEEIVGYLDRNPLVLQRNRLIRQHAGPTNM